VGPRDHQLGMSRGQARENIAAQSVAEENGIVFPSRHGVDPVLQFNAAFRRGVVVALSQEIEIDDVGGDCGRLAEFPNRDFAGNEFEIPAHCLFAVHSIAWATTLRRLGFS
jgi:hypothetical protein